MRSQVQTWPMVGNEQVGSSPFRFRGKHREIFPFLARDTQEGFGAWGRNTWHKKAAGQPRRSRSLGKPRLMVPLSVKTVGKPLRAGAGGGGKWMGVPVIFKAVPNHCAFAWTWGRPQAGNGFFSRSLFISQNGHCSTPLNSQTTLTWKTNRNMLEMETIYHGANYHLS